MSPVTHIVAHSLAALRHFLVGLPSAAPHSAMLGFPHDDGVRVFTWILILTIFTVPRTKSTAGLRT